MAVKFTVSPVRSHENLQFVVIGFEIEGGIIEPTELSSLTPPQIPAGCGVLLSGRGPVWLYSFLTHWYHPALFIAVFDPRFKAGVVTESHTKKVKPGDLIPV